MINALLRNQRLRNLIPRRAKVFFAENRNWFSKVNHRSTVRNIFHCCVHKTGSQWIRRMLCDPIVYAQCGLRTYVYHTRMVNRETRPILERTFHRPFPIDRLLSPIYISFQNFQAIPKPDEYRAIFVGRDPRDLAVSWLFSTRNAHPNMQDDTNRTQLRDLSDREGLQYAIKYLADSGEYRAMASWFENRDEDPKVRVIRYEDLVGDRQSETFRQMFQHLDVRVNDAQLGRLLDRHSFEKQTGRKSGTENRNSKMRKGVAGDWRNYFDDELEQEFTALTGDLLDRLGYE